MGDGEGELPEALAAPIWGHYALFRGHPRITGLVLWDVHERQVIVAGKRGEQKFDEVLSAPRPPVQPGDVVRCDIKGRTGIYGEVTEIKDGIVYFRPLCPATGWRHASAREVVGHWQKAGRRGGEHNAPLVPREQLSLPGVHT